MSFANRTKYTPLWETWCDKCGEGVSPDHANRCAYCGGALRRNHHANVNHPNRYPTIPTGLFDAARRAQEAGIPIGEFAREALHLTQRSSAGTLAQSIRHEFRRRGWPVRTSAEAGRIGKDRYRRRLALGERPDGLCTGRNRMGEPCKRHATPGTTYCNLHDPSRRERVQQNYAERLRRTHRMLRERRRSWAHYAPLLRAWSDSYGWGARTAALRRAGVTFNVYQGMLDYERRGIDHPITEEYAARLDALLETPAHRLPSDGLKRGGPMAVSA